jgi:hypothetical protein
VVGRSLHFALRDLRAHLGQRSVAAALGGAALILGIAGPFDTLGRMALVPRLAHWAAAVGLTHAVGFLATAMAEPRLPARPAPVRLALSALASGSGATAALLLLNAGMGSLPEDLGGLAAGVGSVMAIALVIEVARAWAEPRAPDLAPPRDGGPGRGGRGPRRRSWPASLSTSAPPLWRFPCRTTTWTWSPRGDAARS